ncbi:hypothetical protein MLD38_037680 [Melastoma candidum]|uniref:Uncharacterized protein n=1 Tax=Melastoma candidum TaxID=119954 RepID=A0ACB9LQ63_9MYRT|nr:hypothetical protein MLD38_037680 [Melastoma candidum]
MSPPQPTAAVLNPPSHLQPIQFPTHEDAPDVSPSARIICELLVRVPPSTLEPALSAAAIFPTPALVEEVLRYSYNYPASAVKFFQWAGVGRKHAVGCWNLIVDLLGKNQLFEKMWEMLRAMRLEGAVNMAAFESAFGSYCTAKRVEDAVRCFDVLGEYGVEQDVVAVNSLLIAICKEEGMASKAMEFFDRVREKVPPDGETFTVLFERLEIEGDATKAQMLFEEMVLRIGLHPGNVRAYNALLITLMKGSNLDEALKCLNVMKGKNCLPGLRFFSFAIDILLKKKDSDNAMRVWEVMAGSGLIPSLVMCNAMVGLLTENKMIDDAFRILDEMPLHGVFPDASTYNMIFSCLIKNKSVRETSGIFEEMIKNEYMPTPSNCAMAISMFFDQDDPEMSVEVWNYMVDNGVRDLDASANELLLGLYSLGRFQELKSFSEDMLDRRVNIYDSTMEKLQVVMSKIRNRRTVGDTCENILKRRKA